jgi:plasmid stabilization system protein ParE
MSPSVVYLPEARDDIDAAYVGYEQQQTGLGGRFLESVRDQVARIQANPALYGVVHQDVRAAPIRRFPYVVYYRIEGGQVVVVAVQHGSRGWSSWLSRI